MLQTAARASRLCKHCIRASLLSPGATHPVRASGRIQPTSTQGWTSLHVSCASANVSTDSASPVIPRRPSPYRLLPPHTFLSQFAPLHVAGWRLDLLPTAQPRLGERHEVEEGMADLQDRRLVRLYEFESGRQGWGELMRFVVRIGEAVEEEDHHPTILIAPASDYASTTCLIPSPGLRGYVLEVATHTHTPMPAGKGEKGVKMRPGVTGKDMRLAEAVEEIYRELTRSVLI